MKNYFLYEESPYFKDGLMLRVNLEMLPDGLFEDVKGSYNVLPARLLNLRYVDYLKVCRDLFDATLCGQTGYVIPYFMNESKLKKLIEFLNGGMELALEERKIWKLQESISLLEEALADRE